MAFKWFVVSAVLLTGFSHVGAARAQQAAPRPAQPAAPRSAVVVPAAPVTVGSEFVIGPEDLLQISVWKNESLSRQLPVRPDGKISMPLLHDVQAAGLTPMQLRDKLAAALAEFMPNPEVSVTVLESSSARTIAARRSASASTTTAPSAPPARRTSRSGPATSSSFPERGAAMATTPPSLHDESSRGLGLSAVLEVVRRRRVLAILPCLFVLAAVASMAVFLPSLWTAKATVLVNRQEMPEALVRSTVNTDPEARLLTLTYETLDTPRLTKIIQDNNLYPGLRRSKPAAEVVERMRKDIKIDIPEERERRGSCSRWATRPPIRPWPPA